jgi:hypothetical protein
MARCIQSWNVFLAVAMMHGPCLGATFDLESARKMTLDTPAAIDTLAQELQPLGPRLDVVFANRNEWSSGVRVAAALARCASQYPVPAGTHTGPTGQGPSLLDAPACLAARLAGDEEATRLAVEGSRSRLRELPAHFKRGSTQWYDRTLYEFVSAALVLATMTPIREGRPEPADATLLLGLLDDDQKPVEPRIELAYALLAAQWADPARAATAPFDKDVRLAFVRLGLAEGGRLGTLLLPAHRREDPEFSRRLEVYPDTIEALRQMGKAAALKETPWPDVWPAVVQPISLEALGPLQVEYMRGYYEAKGDDVPSVDASQRVLQYVADPYRAELVRKVKGRYLYDEAVWELTWRRTPAPQTLRALMEAGYVPWRVDVTRAVPRLLFDPPPQPLPGAHVPRAPPPLRQMTFAAFRKLMPDTAARVIAAVVPPGCSASLQSVYVESDVARGIAFALCTASSPSAQLIGLRFDPTRVVRVEGIEYSMGRGGSKPAVVAVYDADRDGFYEVLLDEEENIGVKDPGREPWLLEEYQGVFRYFHADPPRVWTAPDAGPAR